VLAACTTLPAGDSPLAQARSEYNNAQANPQVAAYAAGELKRAAEGQAYPGENAQPAGFNRNRRRAAAHNERRGAGGHGSSHGASRRPEGGSRQASGGSSASAKPHAAPARPAKKRPLPFN